MNFTPTRMWGSGPKAILERMHVGPKLASRRGKDSNCYFRIQKSVVSRGTDQSNYAARNPSIGSGLSRSARILRKSIPGRKGINLSVGESPPIAIEVVGVKA